MSTPPGNLPPPPPQPSSPTQIAGQQAAPSTSVPPGPTGSIYAQTGVGTTNTLAIVSLIAGIGSFFAHIVPGVGGFTVALIAVITGYMARQQIRQTGEQGMGMATAGMIIGAVHIALLVLLVVGLIFAIFVFGLVLFGMHR
ncbi:MAG TPA: DUF4190 domain-containing protein [Candidatus Dormibacteraeota bacterium]|nr:DUF4190 domain-containing protein [Candidatus Dormibacteraeota bacterium]